MSATVSFTRMADGTREELPHAVEVQVDIDWVPRALGTSLYLRPTIIASEAGLGMRPSKRFIYYVIMTPAGQMITMGAAGILITNGLASIAMVGASVIINNGALTVT